MADGTFLVFIPYNLADQIVERVKKESQHANNFVWACALRQFRRGRELSLRSRQAKDLGMRLEADS